MEGDQHKMREALEFVHDKLLTWNYTDKATAKMAVAIVDRCSKALSAPPRNCDVYDPDKAAHMMEVEYCGSMHPSHCDGTNCTRCSFKWFTSPAEERKGEDKK